MTRIRAEVTGMPMPRDYDLSKFDLDEMLADSSVTLHRMISHLIFNRKATKNP